MAKLSREDKLIGLVHSNSSVEDFREVVVHLENTASIKSHDGYWMKNKDEEDFWREVEIKLKEIRLFLKLSASLVSLAHKGGAK